MLQTDLSSDTKDRIVTTYRDNQDHPVEECQMKIDTFLVNLKTIVRESQDPVPAIYRNEISAFHSDNTYDVVSMVPTYCSVQASLYQSRAKDISSLLRTRADIYVPEIYTKTTVGDNFLMTADAENNKILIFTTDDNLRHLATSDALFCDGTFDKCPTLFCQLYTIHALVDNKMFPLIYHFSTDGPRTTNHVEGWHRKLSHLINTSHPNLFRIIDFLKSEQSQTETTFLQLRAGGKVRPRKKKYRHLDNAIEMYKRQFLDGTKSAIEYLDAVSHLTGF